ncbi:2-C-methyl-D-erythritol 4-phosphate cytidylyltransferase [Methylophilaceae bacterium]|jgi:2-C-methyl-D-erythritol 4-phosphate cytidylyltransferase|nr:2-C-methyl-D-erythritol 4-phosphate cytidylyltransferase [Methylophilaceae bacterium]|tara:strand:- start:4529 stop:5221 length:693 start_codon:yes stop_codon:yes gene_type:complete
MENIHLIIPAAGESSRMGSTTPKQFSNFHGKTILEYVESIFSKLATIKTITIALNKKQKYIESLNCQFSNKTTLIDCGGSNRSETVLNALSIIGEDIQKKDWIMVHDAARVGITESLVNNFIREIVDDKVGGILAIPALDTVKRVDKKQQIIRTEKRDEIWLAQTPQMFRFDLLNKALTSFKGNPTDESEAIEAFGLSPKIVKGSLVNFKITYPDDLMRVEKLIQGSNHD